MIPSRRKSCSACVRGKRRCDLGFPQCGRCLARQVTCEYAWITPEEAQEVVRTTASSIWTPQEDPCHSLDRSCTTIASHPRQDSPGPRESRANYDIAFWPARTIISPAAVSLIDELTGRGRITSFLDPDFQLQCLNKQYPNAGPDAHAPQPPHFIGMPLAPSKGITVSSIYTGKSFQARAEYAASRLVRQIRTLAETGQTSFIHHSQMDGSTILRDVFAACSLMTTRNSANGALVLSEITRRAELLIEATETVISLTPPSSQSTMVDLDLLPAVQAMLMYQFMRLFSTGDIAQKTQAELDAKSLARWVDILHEQSHQSWNNHCSGIQFDLPVWEDWVQAESVQRTIAFAELLDSIYNFLKFSWYQPSARMASLRFTGQVAIWEARSLAEWHQAREQKPWVELIITGFHNGIKAALPDDLDELGIIILASYDGVDALKEWAGDDKRLLEKWGLSSGNDFSSFRY